MSFIPRKRKMSHLTGLRILDPAYQFPFGAEPQPSALDMLLTWKDVGLTLEKNIEDEAANTML